MADKKISALTGATTPLAGSEVLPIVQGGATVKVSVDNLTAGKNMSTAVITNVLAAGSTDAGLTNYIQYYNVGTPGSTANLVRFAGAVASDIYFGRVINADAFGWGAVNGAEWLRLSSAGQTLKVGNWIQGIAGNGVNFTANTPAAGMTSQLLNWYEEGTWTPNQGAGLTLVGAFSSTGKYTRIGRSVTISATVTGATSVAVTAAGVITSNLPFTVGTAGHGSATNAANTAFASVICTTTNVTSAGAIAATATITFSATYFV